MANGTSTKSASKTVSPSGGKPQEQRLKAKPVLITPVNPRTGKPSGPTRVGSSRGPVFKGKTTEDLPFVEVEQKTTPKETKMAEPIQPVQRFEASKLSQQRTGPEAILGKPIERKVATVQKVIPGTRIPVGAPQQLVQGTVKALERGEEVVVSKAEFEALQKEKIKTKASEQLTATEVAPGKIAIKKELSPEGKQAFEIVRSASPIQKVGIAASTLFSKKGGELLGDFSFGLFSKKFRGKAVEDIVERQAEIIKAQKEGRSTASLALESAVKNPFTQVATSVASGFGVVKLAGTKIGAKIIGTKTAKTILGLGAASFFAKESATTIRLVKEGEQGKAFGRALVTGASLTGAIAGAKAATKTTEAFKPKEIRGIRITEKVDAKATPFQRVENLEQLPKDIRVDVSKSGASTLFTKTGKQGFAVLRGKELVKPNPDLEIISGARTPQAQEFGKDKFFLFKTKPVSQVLRTSTGAPGSTINVKVESQVGIPVSTTPPKDFSSSVFRIQKFAGTGRDLFVEKGASPLVSKLTGGRVIFKPGNIGKSLKGLFTPKTKQGPVITTVTKKPRVKIQPTTSGRTTETIETTIPQSQVEVFETPIALPTPSRPFIFIPSSGERIETRLETIPLTQQAQIGGFGQRNIQLTEQRTSQDILPVSQIGTKSFSGSASLLSPVQSPISEQLPIQQPIQAQRPIQSLRPIQKAIQLARSITGPTKTPPLPRINLGFGKRKKFGEPSIKGFDVFLKIKGKFQKVNLGGSLERRAALALGASKVERSALRTFKILPSQAPVVRSPLATGAFTPGKFRAPRGRSAKELDVFVEKSKFAINTAGERFDITAKSLNRKGSKTKSSFENVLSKRYRSLL